MATGYNTLDVLAEINDESLAEIEEIVNNEYPNESCFRHQPIPICFYHQMRSSFNLVIVKESKKIVDEAKQLVGTCTRAGKGKQSKHGKDDLLRQISGMVSNRLYQINSSYPQSWQMKNGTA